MAARPLLDRDQIDAHLEALSREPFRDALGKFLQATPDTATLEAWAKQKPDRWAQSLAIVARLSGYTDKLEIEGTINNVHTLSDAELLRRAQELRGDTVEGEYSLPSETTGDE